MSTIVGISTFMSRVNFVHEKSFITSKPGPKISINFVQMKIQLLIQAKVLKNKDFFLPSKISDVVFIMLIKFKMPTIVGILIFMSMIIPTHSCVEHNKNCITLGPGP